MASLHESDDYNRGYEDGEISGREAAIAEYKPKLEASRRCHIECEEANTTLSVEIRLLRKTVADLQNGTTQYLTYPHEGERKGLELAVSESFEVVPLEDAPVSDSPEPDADIWKTVAGYAASDVVALRDAMLRLTNLKAHKDEHGKTDYYLENQPLAWRQALDALSREGVQTEPVANEHEQ